MRLLAVKARAFAPREILLRTEGRVRYVTLSSRFQIATASALLLAGGWFAFSSITYVVNQHRLSAKDREIVQTKGAYADLLGEVAQYYENFNELTHSLTAAESLLRGMAQPPPDQNEAARVAAHSPMGVPSVPLKPDRLRQKLLNLQENLRGMVDRNRVLSTDIASLQEQLRKAEDEKLQINQALNEKTAALQAQLSQSEDEKRRTNQELSGDITSLREQLKKSEEEAERVNAALGGNISTMQQKLHASEDEKRRNDAALTGDIATLQEQLRRSEDEKRQANLSLTGDIKALREKLNSSEEQLTRVNSMLNGNISAVQAQLQASEEERQRVNDNLGDRIATLQSQLRYSEDEKRRMDEKLHANIAELQGQLRMSQEEKRRIDLTLNADIENLQHQLNLTEAEKQKIIAARDQIGARLESTEANLAQMNDQNESLHVAIQDLETRLAALDEARSTALAEAGQARSESASTRTSLSAQISDLQTQLKTTHGGIVDLQIQIVAEQQARAAAAADAERARSETASTREALTAQIEDLTGRLNAAHNDVADLEGRLSETKTELAAALSLADGARSEMASTRESLSSRVAALEEELNSARTNVASMDQKLDTLRTSRSRLEQRLGSVQQALATVIMQRDTLQTARTSLGEKVAVLEDRLAVTQAAQDTIVRKIAERTRNNVDEAEKILAMTGLDVERMLQRAAGAQQATAQGGPFLPVAFKPDDSMVNRLLTSVASIGAQVDRWEGLQVLLRTLPLTAPIDHYGIASDFGPRADPFNGRLAMHEGLDFGADMRTPIMATAAGRVVVAGWEGGYGRMVEVDHGFGIHTRYAHLNDILVKVGDLVDFRQKIGLLGSSGRSTGPHVHYEVRVDGRPYDPMNFLKAGRYVFKG